VNTCAQLQHACSSNSSSMLAGNYSNHCLQQVCLAIRCVLAGTSICKHTLCSSCLRRSQLQLLLLTSCTMMLFICALQCAYVVLYIVGCRYRGPPLLSKKWMLQGVTGECNSDELPSHPSPSFPPEAVVEAQLAALRWGLQLILGTGLG
jgi:hypothetical protein